MSTMFQPLINASKLQRRSIHSSKTAISKVRSTLKPLSQTSGLNSILNSKYIFLTTTLLILTLLFVNNGWGQTCPTIPTAAGTHVVTFDVGNNCTFTIPAGVTSIKVQAWGGGGSGGASGSGGGGGGGAGGNYAQKNSISVTGGTSSIIVTVGAGGNNSAGGQSSVSVGAQSWVEAEGGGKGGNGCANCDGAGGLKNVWRWCYPGGNGTCDVSSSGGNGSCGPNSASGGGGGEGGCSSGTNGAGMTSCGTGGGYQSGAYGNSGCDGGNGGGGATSAVAPGNGIVPGGGGGGRYKGNAGNGGTGGGGRVIITYTVASSCSVGAASSSPTPCINTLITNVTHTTSGVTGITSSSGLPTGVSAAYASNTITISGTPSQSGTFNYTITPTGCATTATGTITVAAASVGGSVTGGSTPICQGSGTGTMTQGSHTGSIVKWQKRVNSGAWSDIVNTATTYSETPSSAGTWEYRAEIKSGACASVFSTARSIVVDAVPSVPGSVTTSNVSCTSLTLNWGAATDASGYEIQVSTNSGFSTNLAGNNCGGVGCGGSSDVGNVTTASITGLSANTQYWIRVRARNGSTPCRSGWTNLGTTSVTTVGNTSVSTQPSNATICFGGSNSPSVVGSGGVTLSYQWQFNNSGTWGSVSDGTPTNATYSNPNSNNTFSIGGNISAGSYQYRCVVSSTGGCNSTNSNTATLTINADPSAPTATKSPNSASACAGATLTLSSPTYGADAGMSCGFEYSSSTDGASWSGYGDAIPSFTAVAGTNGIRIRVKGGCGNGCNASSYTEYTWTVTAFPTINASSGASRCGTGPLGISATASAGSIEWFAASTGGTSLGSSNSGVSWTTPSISTTTTYYAEAVNGSCRSTSRTAVTATVNTATYRSAATGNWSDATKWEISCDGTNWTAANVAPGSGDGVISIRDGHNMAVAASASVDELTIDAGATLTVNASQTLTIANGTGDDLTVNGSIIINGTISNSGAIKLNSGGLYNHANGTALPTGISWGSSGTQGTLEVSGSATCSNLITLSTTSELYNVIWTSSGSLPTGGTSGSATLCKGDFTLNNASASWQIYSSGSSSTSKITVNGNVTLSEGTINCNDGNGTISGGTNSGLDVAGNYTQSGGTFNIVNTGSGTYTGALYVQGNFTHTGGTFSSTGTGSVFLNGTSGTQLLESTGQSGSITFNVAGSNAQCVLSALKTFVQSANTTFTIAAGTSTPDLLINGTFTRTGTSLTTTGTMSVASGGTYQHNCNGQSLPSATWDAASRCIITGTSSTTPTNFGQTFGDLTLNCSGTATTDANSTVAGNLTVSGGTLTVGNNFTLGITGNSSITGTLTLGGTGAKTFSGNATIISPGTLNVSGSGAYSLAGNFTNNGTFTPGTAILTLNGGGAQTLDGSSALSFSNITINKSGGTLTAAKDMTITGTLTLTSGILDMNSKTLTMGTSSANGTITGGSASSYILALDATTPSKLIHRVNSTANATYSFPIGTGSKYTPVTVVMKGGTLSNASIQVWTKNSKVTGMSTAMNCYLKRSWFVEPTGITSPNYDIQLGFASGDFTGDAGFDLNPVKLSSGVWYKPSGSLLQNGTTQGTTIATTFTSPSTPTSSSGTVYWNALTSFSEFGGGGGSAPLPVELVSFSGSCEDGNVNLSWQTASEFNSSHFEVEKSRDGENWQVIETIPAAGNSHELLNYETFDQVSNALNYYRLNQVDIDGTNKRYDPIAVSCEASSNGIFITYPNPSNEGFNILINDNELEGEMNMNIYTATGSVALQKRIVVKEGINVFMMNEKLLPGVYFIEVKDQQNKTKVIKHLVN